MSEFVYGTPTDSQLEKINRIAKRPLSKEEVFVFNAKLAGDMVIPDRYIKLHKTLLTVFKEDAIKGVAFLLDHPWAGWSRPKPALVYGRTFDAQLKKSDIEGEEWALFADHYLVRGKEKDGISTDAIIQDIEDGTLFDTSVGWGSSTYICSICNKNYFTCEHWRGGEYDGQVCYVVAKPPGGLYENSGVFDGAYPGAGILSNATVLDDSGNGEIVVVEELKGLPVGITLFHTYSASKNKLLTFARRGDTEKIVTAQGITLSKGGEKTVSQNYKIVLDGVDVSKFIISDDAAVVTLDKSALNELPTVKEMLKNAAESSPAPEPYVTREQAKEAIGRDATADEVLRLAKEGDDYIQALQKEAKEWGVRAKGDKFNAEAWEVRFKQADSKELKDLIETFKEEAKFAIPAGRQTDPQAGKSGTVQNEIPDEAYKA